MTGNDLLGPADTIYAVPASSTAVVFQCPACDTQPVATRDDATLQDILIVVSEQAGDAPDDQSDGAE